MNNALSCLLAKLPLESELSFLVRGKRLCEIPGLEPSVIAEVEEIFGLL